MCKWRIWYGFDPNPRAASDYPDQSALEGLGVTGGIFDDGVGVCPNDPGDPRIDWDAFIENNLPPANALVQDTLPNALDGSWAASYAWDLN